MLRETQQPDNAASAGGVPSSGAPCRSIYVHLPFCRTRCGYCDFYVQLLSQGAVTPLVDAVLAELAAYQARVPLAVDTIFVGGGTPTVLPPAELARVLAALRTTVAPDATLEFTVEANPATVTDEVARVLVDHGVNRVSLGAQSFEPAELRALQRTHQPAQVGQTLDTCRRHGLERLSIDLIFGIPGQTLASWEQNLKTAVGLGVEHLSCYGLTYESGTPLHKWLHEGRVQKCDEDLEADMYERMLDILPAAGLALYEISNFARPGAACRHNLRYWYNEPYLGLGPSAAGYVAGVRYKNVPDTAAYVQGIQVLRAGGRPAAPGGTSARGADSAGQPSQVSGGRTSAQPAASGGRASRRAVSPDQILEQETASGAQPSEQSPPQPALRLPVQRLADTGLPQPGGFPWSDHEQLTGDAAARETAVLALRLSTGVNRPRFIARHGCDPAVAYADALAPHVADGLVTIDANAIRLTRRGLLLANTVMRDLVSA